MNNKKVNAGELVKLTDKIFNAFAEDFPGAQNQPLKVIAADDDGVTLEAPIFGETEWAWMAVIPAMPAKPVMPVKPVSIMRMSAESLLEDIDDTNALAELEAIEA